MYVREIPGHPVGMPFPGGDKVDYIDGVYYCPVRTKGHDEDAALCPFCPARQHGDRISKAAHQGKRTQETGIY